MSLVRIIHLFVAVSVAALCAAADVSAQDTTGVGAIQGVVRDGSGAGVGDVRVCALGTAQCATTDAAGQFRLSGLRAGPCQLEVLAPAGLPFHQSRLSMCGRDSTARWP